MQRRCLGPDDLERGMHVIVTEVRPEESPSQADDLAGQVKVITAAMQPDYLHHLKGIPLTVKAVDLPFVAVVPVVRPDCQAVSVDVRRVALIRASDEFAEACGGGRRPWWRRLFS